MPDQNKYGTTIPACDPSEVPVEDLNRVHALNHPGALDFDGQDLLAWCRVDDNWPRKEMFYKDAVEDQVLFVRDQLPKAYAADQAEYTRATSGEGTKVVGLHTSKSCVIPVYGIDIPSLGVRAVLSYNFHNWVVSVTLPRPVDLSIVGDLSTAKPVASCYASGFKDEWCFGVPTPTATKFTLFLGNKYEVYLFFRNLAYQLRGK